MERIRQPPYDVDVRDGVFVISGGVLMYFHTEQMHQFFCALAEAFPGGGICFDGENQRGVDKSNKVVQKTGNGTEIHFPIENAKEQFASWGDCFREVRERPFPAYVKQSREVPTKWKLILSLGIRLGMVKIIEVFFCRRKELCGLTECALITPPLHAVIFNRAYDPKQTEPAGICTPCRFSIFSIYFFATTASHGFDG